jgi:carbonic anhydrase
MLEIVYRYDPDHPCHVGPPSDAGDARRRLENGNREFAHIFDVTPCGRATARRIVPIDPRDLGVGDEAGQAPRQQPFAVVLGCSDARVPTELIFNKWCNELFVVRVAGNVLGTEALGSIDYAVHNLGDSVKLLVVLAHSGCGAVTAATDIFLKPAQYLGVATSHPLRAIIDRLVVVVRGAARALELVWGADVTTVIVNAALTAYTLQREFQPRPGGSPITTVFGVYDLASRCVRLPGAENAAEVHLSEPPASTEAFSQLASRVAGSDAIFRQLVSA